MKEVKLWGKILSFSNWYIVKDVSELNSPEIMVNTFDYPFQDWVWINDLKVWSKQIQIITSLRKPNDYEFFNEINDLKGEVLNQLTKIYITRNKSATETVNLVWDCIVRSISIDSERSWMTFWILTIIVEVMSWTLKDFFDYVYNFNIPWYSHLLTATDSFFWNYKYIYPIIKFVSNISNWYDRIRFIWNWFYIENIDIAIASWKELIFDFEKWKVFYDWVEVDTSWIMWYMERWYTNEIQIYKNWVLADNADIDIDVEMRTRPRYI